MKKDTLNRKAYPTDLTDEQWAVIAPLFTGMRQYKYITPTVKDAKIKRQSSLR